MAGLGVASFGHVNGVHMQNLDTWETYSAAIERGEIPLSRAYRPTDEERLIRELVLQLKLGSMRPQYFRDKYHVNILERFSDQFASLAAEGELHRGRRRRGGAVAARSAANRFAAAAVFPASAPAFGTPGRPSRVTQYAGCGNQTATKHETRNHSCFVFVTSCFVATLGTTRHS